MNTIHILRLKKNKQKELIKLLYKKFLYKDPLWHYFVEPDLIIRVTDDKVIKQISTYLHLNYYNFDIYPYPISKESVSKGGADYDEGEKSITVRYLKHFMAVYHAQCIFNLEIDEKEKPEMRAKLIHALYNQDFLDWEYEMQTLSQLALNQGKIIGRFGRKE